MGYGKWAAGLAAASLLAACQTIPQEMTVAEYCANPKNATENICRVYVDVDGNKVAIANTNMKVSEAMSLVANAQKSADAALIRADDAMSAAQRAQSTADAAAAQAQQASIKDNMQCVTRTLNKVDTGTCEPGYTVMSCQQTRFTYAAGGMSIMREINDDMCRYNTKVLEMQVRCCRLDPSRAQRNVVEQVTPPVPYRAPQQSTPLRY